MTTFLRLAPLALLVAATALTACGDDPVDPVHCNESRRFVVETTIGGETHLYTDVLGGRVSDEGVAITYDSFETETGAVIQRIVYLGSIQPFGSGGAFFQAVASSADNAYTIGAYTTEAPCDASAGQLCAFVGTDENSDGLATLDTESLLPSMSGTAALFKPNGNDFHGEFEFVVSDNTHENALFNIGEGTGGTVRGCFYFNVSPDQAVLD